MSNRWESDEVEFLKRHYEDKGPKWCVEKLNRTYYSIYSQASKLKLTELIRYPINQNYFDEINHENAWILGFLCADGCLKNNNGLNKKFRGSNNIRNCWWCWCLSIRLSYKDKHILEYIRNQISQTRPIHDYKTYCKDTNKYNDCSQLDISGLNENFVTKIKYLGVFPNKTGKEFVPDIPEKYLWSWMLGLFDGDGCICKDRLYNSYTFGIASGSKQFLLQLKDKFFKKYHCNFYNKKETNGWSLRIFNQDSIKEIAQKMYENAPFCLQRKKQRFIDWGLYTQHE